MSANHKIPTGFTFVNEDDRDRLIYLLREYHSNAINHNAKKAFAVLVHYNNAFYLAYAHDGDKFEHFVDVSSNGCVPNISKNKGAAFQGAGMAYGAVKNHQMPELLIAATCMDRTKVVGRGYPDYPSNSWLTDDVTKEWLPVLKKLLPGWDKDYNVLYLTKVQLKQNRSDENFIKSELTTTLANIAPTFLGDGKVDLHFCQSVIGHEFKHKSLDFTSMSQSGATNRRCISLDGYLARYADITFKFACEPFSVAVKGQSVQIEEASVILSCFPATKSKSEWLANVRSGNIDGTFAKGTGNEHGKPPTKKAFLVLPCLANEYSGKIKEMRSRFLDNSLCTYNRVGTLMDFLELPYGDGSRYNPFVTIHIYIDKVGKVTDANGQESQCTPDQLISWLGRQSDFTLSETSTAHQIMQAACGAAAANVPEDLRAWCEQQYPEPEDKFVNFLLGAGGTLNVQNTRDCPVDIYNLTGKTPVLFDKIFHAGEQVYLAIYHRELNRFLSLQDVARSNKTRGVEFTPVTSNGLKMLLKNTAKAHNKLREQFPDHEIPILQVDVAELGYIVEGGVAEITAEDYKHTADYIPSRHVQMSHNQCEIVNLGIVAEVPIQVKKSTPPPPGPRIKKEKGTGSTSADGYQKARPYVQRDEEVIGEYSLKTKLFYFNEKHAWVKEIFRINAQPGSALFRYAESIYNHFKSLAEGLYGGLIVGDFQGKEKANWEGDEKYNDAQDWLLNQLLRTQIENNPLIKELADKIRKKISQDTIESDDE